MAARSGKEFLERLSASHPTVYVQGEELTGGIAGHPAFRNVVRSYAELFDMQLPFPHAYRRAGTGGQGHGMALS
jgi:4-hydroxyphenylacetate 3-monooxygenase